MFKKYRKKPVVIEAIQLLETNLEPHVFDFIGERVNYPECKIGGLDPATGGFMLKTLEGDMRAQIGDWIIKGVNGEFYPCKDDIFKKTYEEVLPVNQSDLIAKSDAIVDGKITTGGNGIVIGYKIETQLKDSDAF